MAYTSAMDTLAYIIIVSLLPGIALGIVVFGLARKVEAALHPTAPPPPPIPPEPAAPSRLLNEAALLSLDPEQRCAMLLTSLDEATGWAVYRLLDPLHGELVAIEIPHLPTFHPSARQQMFESIAEQLELPIEELHQRLAAEPERAAELVRRMLPPTPPQVVEELKRSHSLPEQWGNRFGDTRGFGVPSRPLLSLWDWLPEPSGDWHCDD